MATVTQPVSFTVVNLEPGDGKGFVRVDARFNGSEKIYNYYRKAGVDEYGTFVIIDGCKILFDSEYNVISINREYDTKGVYRKSTKSITKEGGAGTRKRRVPDVSSEESESDWTEADIESERKCRRKRRRREVPQMPDGDDINTEPEVTEEPVESTDDTVEVEEEVAAEEPVREEVPAIPKKIRHERYEDIKDCLECDIPVYLYGPAGSGKNHTFEQIARENGWNFYYTNSVQQEYKLTGFIDAGGRYHETEFYKACTDEEECMFFLDELDASIPEVLVLLNAAIANGYFEFPTGKVSFDHIHFCAAGNTAGSGADDMYTGRMVIDQATLDRFAFIDYNYSRPIELKITGGNVELVEFIHDLRNTAESKGIRATFSYRCMLMVKKLEEKGMSTDKIMKYAILKGLDKDTINSLRLYGSNKYYVALKNLQM